MSTCLSPPCLSACLYLHLYLSAFPSNRRLRAPFLNVIPITIPLSLLFLPHARPWVRQDQINVADVLVGHKADLASPHQLDAFGHWADQLYPPKAKVVLASHGRIDPALLDLPRAPVFRPMFNPQAHRHVRRVALRAAKAPTPYPQPSEVTTGATAAAAIPVTAVTDGPNTESLASVSAAITPTADLNPDPDPDSNLLNDRVHPGTGGEAEVLPRLQPGQPLRFPSAQPHMLSPQPRLPLPQEEEQQQDAEGGNVEGGDGEPQLVSCGWLFSSEDVFDRGRLVTVVSELRRGAARIKGIFRVGKSSYAVPYFQPDGGVELRPVAYRRESRLEVIVPISLSRGSGRDGIARRGASSHQEASSSASSPRIDPGPAAVTTGDCPMLESSNVTLGPDWRPVRLEDAMAAADWDAVEQALLGALQQRC
ncbi:hypothetical protein Vretimale_14275 [Volvox reticuliferus]|uniref:Uncharacterized protein n=1 Tax=Volvox reticuliferus TaxID=1737510 RepID=A0A8J4GPE0_9CHLO|nr:hypothetical protein Vretimale_14275 [Volvox reticuliferus]